MKADFDLRDWLDACEKAAPFASNIRVREDGAKTREILRKASAVVGFARDYAKYSGCLSGTIREFDDMVADLCREEP